MTNQHFKYQKHPENESYIDCNDCGADVRNPIEFCDACEGWKSRRWPDLDIFSQSEFLQDGTIAVYTYILIDGRLQLHNRTVTSPR